MHLRQKQKRRHPADNPPAIHSKTRKRVDAHAQQKRVAEPQLSRSIVRQSPLCHVQSWQRGRGTTYYKLKHEKRGKRSVEAGAERPVSVQEVQRPACAQMAGVPPSRPAWWFVPQDRTRDRTWFGEHSSQPHNLMCGFGKTVGREGHADEGTPRRTGLNQEGGSSGTQGAVCIHRKFEGWRER